MSGRDGGTHFALCSECGHPLSWGHRCSARHRRRFELSDGAHMDVCLDPNASEETVAALRSLGEAAVARMKEDDDA